jgi:hypothetical protein
MRQIIIVAALCIGGLAACSPPAHDEPSGINQGPTNPAADRR